MNQDILISLLENKEVYNNIIKEFPGLYSACINVKQKVSDESVQNGVQKITNFYSTSEKFKELIDKYKKENIKINNISYDINNENNVSGMVLVLDKKEESFKKLMTTAKKEKWIYKGIAIVDEFDSIRLYFY